MLYETSTKRAQPQEKDAAVPKTAKQRKQLAAAVFSQFDFKPVRH
jgi:hypothetical protein